MLFRFARLLSLTVHGIMEGPVIKGLAYGGIIGFLWLYCQFSLFMSFLGMFGVYLATGGWKFTKVVIKTLPRDGRALMFLIHSKLLMRRITKEGGNIVTLFHETVQRNPDKLAFVLVDGHQMTFREVDEYSNAVANYLYGQGYRQGDTIAMFMENCPEYACLWLGMAKIGASAALINFNLRNESLAHCISASNAKGIIFSNDINDAVKECKHVLPSDIVYYNFGDSSVEGAQHINPLIMASSKLPPPKEHMTRFNDKLFYVYTSGTTGLPKAAIVIHSRFFYMAYSTHHFFYMNTNDVIYDTLPLYHTAGGILGIGQAFLNGCTVVIRKKFSASRFWDDCVRYNCTVTQYIGEICRYLLAQPHKPSEKQHRVRVAFGNGLRPQIWVQFKERFGINRIGEFYGATEGNANIINIDNTVGSVGFTTRIAPALYPVTLIKVDEYTGEPVRDRNGMCIKCQPGEPGELVGKIVKGDPLREFDGYANKEATKKKVAEDVFTRGDSAFLTGDILVMDEFGNMYFRDRTGDTFRWRGENVSTSEVEAVVSNIVKLSDATVYGVEVPGSEGRAGMAAVVDENSSIDLVHLYQELVKKLPAYARPLFIRILPFLETTGTFKLKKLEYRKEGINPEVVKDKMYYMDQKEKQYKPLTTQVYEDIKLGKIRF